MADTIVFIDGFDHYSSSHMVRKYTSQTMSAAIRSGRVAGSCLGVSSVGNTIKTFSTSSQAWRIGFALKLDSQTGSTFALIHLRDGATVQCDLSFIATTRKLQFSRNGTLLGSASTTGLSTGIWYYIELYISIKDSISSGNAQLYINGVQEINLAATTDTKNGSTTTADTFVINGAAFWDFNIDDLVISQMDDTTTPTFLGDRRVLTLYPDGNGNYSEFDGSDGNSTNNYQLVDDATNDDADYVTSETVGERDSYTFANPAQTPVTINAVQLTACLRKDDAGARVARTFHRISGSNYESSDITLSTSFEFKTHMRETNPATASAWTASDLNALESGVKVES